MNNMTNDKPRSKWGSSKLGGGPGTLTAVSLVGALPIAALLAWLLGKIQGEGSVLLWVITSIVFIPVVSGTIWFILVDRTSLTDAPDDPESSIEGKWYTRATAGAFWDLLAAIGIGAGAYAIFDIPLSTESAFMILFGLALADVFLRYQVIKMREG